LVGWANLGFAKILFCSSDYAKARTHT